MWNNVEYLCMRVSICVCIQELVLEAYDESLQCLLNLIKCNNNVWGMSP